MSKSSAHRSILPAFLALGGLALGGLTVPTLAQPLLSLDDALHQAMGANRVYRMSEIDARTAANKATWGASGVLPKVDASAGYNKSLNDTRQERVNTAPEVKNGAASTATTAGVTGTWTVFEGLSSLAAHDRLASTAALADQRREQARQDLAAQ